MPNQKRNFRKPANYNLTFKTFFHAKTSPTISTNQTNKKQRYFIHSDFFLVDFFLQTNKSQREREALILF